jgi:hypothetical protein
MNGEFVTKSAMSITETARLVGLSRARFRQLVKTGTFPAPEYEPNTGRPYYSEEKQRTCLEVRRRNCGIDGKPVLFYSRRRDLGAPKAKHQTKKPQGQHVELLEGLKGLGLGAVTAAQVDLAVKELYPDGITGKDQGEVLKAIFLRIRRQDSGNSVGR